jgi:hypothetical protein
MKGERLENGREMAASGHQKGRVAPPLVVPEQGLIRSGACHSTLPASSSSKEIFTLTLN